MDFTNSYSRDIYKQQQARKRHNKNIDGAEKPLDKDTAKRIAEHEYQAEEAAHFYTDMARLYRMGMNPSRETMEQIYERG